MSKTDKTRPTRVREYDEHETTKIRHYCGIRWGYYLECDAHLPMPRTKKEARFRICGPTLYGRSRYYHGHSVPKSFIDAKYNNPMRREARDVLREAAKEYRATGDTDLEPSLGGPRNAAWWYYW